MGIPVWRLTVDVSSGAGVMLDEFIHAVCRVKLLNGDPSKVSSSDYAEEIGVEAAAVAASCIEGIIVRIFELELGPKAIVDAGLDGGLSQELSDQLAVFVEKNRPMVHAGIVRRCTSNDRLDSISWRVDVCTRSKHVEQLNQPIAVVEMKTTQPGVHTPQVVRFQMSEADVDKTLSGVEQIEAAFATTA